MSKNIRIYRKSYSEKPSKTEEPMVTCSLESWVNTKTTFSKASLAKSQKKLLSNETDFCQVSWGVRKLLLASQYFVYQKSVSVK